MKMKKSWNSQSDWNLGRSILILRSDGNSEPNAAVPIEYGAPYPTAAG
jgi:hypothetical protein